MRNRNVARTLPYLGRCSKRLCTGLDFAEYNPSQRCLQADAFPLPGQG